jgi:molybdate transport system regulatory protein
MLCSGISFVLLRATGARVGEVRLVDEDDLIDDPFPGVRLRTLKRKHEVYRLVPVSEDVYNHVGGLLREVGSLRNVDRSYARKLMMRAGLGLGIDRKLLHPHVFRHSRAVELLKAGLSVPEVAAILGHASIQTTMIYLQIAPVDIYRKMRSAGVL